MTAIECVRLDLPQPAASILISPWLDYSLRAFEGGNPLVETDYLVHANQVVPRMVQDFLGNISGSSPDVNVLFRKPHEIKNLNPQLILTGAGEFAVQDARDWATLCREAGVKHEMLVEWGQLHIYALGSKIVDPGVRRTTDAKIVSWIMQHIE